MKKQTVFHSLKIFTPNRCYWGSVRTGMAKQHATIEWSIDSLDHIYELSDHYLAEGNSYGLFDRLCAEARKMPIPKSYLLQGSFRWGSGHGINPKSIPAMSKMILEAWNAVILKWHQECDEAKRLHAVL